MEIRGDRAMGDKGNRYSPKLNAEIAPERVL